MTSWLRKLFGHASEPRGSGEEEIDEEAYRRFAEAKQQGLERALGPMHPLVGHAIIPFEVGGPVHMYYFPNVIPGTAFVTQQLVHADGGGPKVGQIGAYELIAFTRHEVAHTKGEAIVAVPQAQSSERLEIIELRMRSIFTTLARYSTEAVLDPYETCDVPLSDDSMAAVVFDEFRPARGDFMIDGRRHGLLLCVEVVRSELNFARKHGTRPLLQKLMDAGHYPYSDLDRQPVA